MLINFSKELCEQYLNVYLFNHFKCFINDNLFRFWVKRSR